MIDRHKLQYGLALCLALLPGYAAAAEVPIEKQVSWVHDLSIRHLGFGDLNAYYPQLYLDSASPDLRTDRIEMVIQGQWPKTRYFSLTVYDYKWRAIANLNDQEIQPEPGSINPALPGADWNHESRDYEIKIRFQEDPGGAGDANTFYVANGADGLPTDLLRVAYRVYLPSSGEPLDENLYTPTVFFRNFYTGRIVNPPDIFFDDPAAAGFDLEDTDPPPPVDVLADCDLAGQYQNALQWRRSFEIPITSENPDTLYIFAPFQWCKRYNLVVSFKVPEVADTYDNIGITGDEEMRYWSISLGGNRTNAKLTLTDEGPNRAVIGSDGYVRLVLGRGQRPFLATETNGYTWVDLKKLNMRNGVVILRQMLPSDDFEFSALPVEPGEFVQDELGEYLPGATYVQGRHL